MLEVYSIVYDINYTLNVCQCQIKMSKDGILCGTRDRGVDGKLTMSVITMSVMPFDFVLTTKNRIPHYAKLLPEEAC